MTPHKVETNSSCDRERLDLLKFVVLVKTEAEAGSEGDTENLYRIFSFPQRSYVVGTLWVQCTCLIPLPIDFSYFYSEVKEWDD